MTNIDPTPTPVEERKKSKKRFLIWGSVLAIGALITAAAFTDSEWAFLSAIETDQGQTLPDPDDPGTEDPPITIPDGRFNLQLSGDGAAWADYTRSAPMGVYLPGASTLAPGGETGVATYYVGNNSAEFEATNLFIALESTSATSPDLLEHLRFTVAIDEETVFDDVGWAQVNAGAFEESGIVLAPMVDGEIVPAGQAEVTVQVRMDAVGQDGAAPTQEEMDALKEASAGLFVRVTGSSQVPSAA